MQGDTGGNQKQGDTGGYARRDAYVYARTPASPAPGDAPPASTITQQLERVLHAQRVSRLSGWDPGACELELQEWHRLQAMLPSLLA